MIFIGTHHKTGTILFANIFRAVAQQLSLNFYSGPQKTLPPEAQVWFNEHSIIDRAAFLELTGIHAIRHPLELICSAYRYHVLGNEVWFTKPESGLRYDLKGISYQQHLSTISVREGILFEMKNFSYRTIMAMYNWNYLDESFLNIKLEDVVGDFDATFSRVFSFCGLESSKCLPIAQTHDLKRMNRDLIEGFRHVTNKSGELTWKNYFSDGEMIDRFRKTFPRDLLPKLGYGLD